ncbi:MFS transporter [Epidermidibacterium keratini]|uniref:MFS transporter n=1 Tax=Epidermidibacterium keratini TaxID=1891644 RepID=A0A7L4YKI3_9ACTN|nr:MFS transporter [Epidermidibacterium keratini]QHB99760.1 MFS transporter [Epidermidibacterium keratini]
MSQSRRQVVIAILGVLVAAACLRPAITSFGPVLDRIAADTGLSAGVLGILGSLPLVMFGLVSPWVHRMAARLGTERLLATALGILAVGTALRSVPGNVLLWLGTVLIGGAIAVGNVLVPSIVKRDFGKRMSLMTSLYTAVMGGMAALASGLAVPIADATGTWRWALGGWLALAVAGCAIWTVRPNQDDVDAQAATSGSTSVWRVPTAWYVSLFMGFQSSVFYMTITWLPTYETDHGYTAATAGWHLFAYQVTGILCGFAIAIPLDRSRSQSTIAAAVSIWMVLAVLGMLLFPDVMWLWAVLGGVSSGASLVVALSLIGLRSRTHSSTVRLSGMAQSVGYLIAAAATVGAGAIVETSSSRGLLVAMAIIAAIQTIFGVLAGRDVYVDDAVTARV